MIPVPPPQIFNCKTKSYFTEYGYVKTLPIVLRILRIMKYKKDYYNKCEINLVTIYDTDEVEILYRDEYQVVIKE